MPDPAPTDTRLNDLKQRWEQDPGSRLYLQLADEYRKLGQYNEAESVLEKGLSRRPNDLSGLVALGRCRLELTKLEGAIESLETVIARDPAHMVANKVLIEAYLQASDAERAGERFEIYRLLNDRDPELDHLEYRLRQLRTPPSQEIAVEESPEELFEEPETIPDVPAEEVALEQGAEELFEEPEPIVEAPAEEVALEQGAERLFGEPEPISEAPQAAAPVPEEAVEEPPPEPATPAETVPAAAQGNGHDIFQLPDVASPPTLESLWSQSLRSRGPDEPFADVTELTETGHMRALTQEGIFGAPDVTPPEPAAEVFVPVAEEVIEPAAPRSAHVPSAEPEVRAEAVVPEPVLPIDLDEGPTRQIPFEPLTDEEETTTTKIEVEAPTQEPPVPELVAEPPAEEMPIPELAAEPPAAELPVAEPLAAEPPIPEWVAEPPAAEPPISEWVAEPPAAEPPVPEWVAESPPEEPPVPEVAVEAPAAEPPIPQVSTEAPTIKLPTVEPPAWDMAEAPTVKLPKIEPPLEETVAEAPAQEPPPEISAEPPPTAAEESEEEAATVTLGGLYLKQGHFEEAARIFDKVLEKDPGNQAATAGLNLARRPKEPSLTALDLLSDRSLAGTIPAGLTAKKILVLTNYLKHLTSTRGQSHVH